MNKPTFLSRLGIHSTLGLLVVWSVVPFLWTVQTSIKFTRDVAAKKPVLWGYETTASAYNSFWLSDDELNMWHVLWFLVLLAGVLLMFGQIGKRGWFTQWWPAAFVAATAATLAVWLPRSFDLEETNFGRVSVLSILVLTGLALLSRYLNKAWPWYLSVFLTMGVALWTFPRLFEVEDEYYFLVNSLIVTMLTVLISISIGLLAGYGLARYTGISGALILVTALGFRALPRSAFVLPYFFGAKRIDQWLEDTGIATWDFPLIDFPGMDELAVFDSRLAIVIALVAVNQPFTIWMLRTFFMDVPREMEEAAMMDGATRFQAFRKVIIPIMWPGIIATSLFTMLLAYNEFLFVRLLATTNWTLPVAIVSLTGGESSRTITEGAAASVSITLPIVIVIILFQKHLVKGLGAGAVKG